MSETTNRSATDDESKDTHSFLLEDDRINPPAEMVMALREYLNDMPETKTVFKLKDAFEVGQGVGETIDKVIGLCGVWRVPEIYPQGSGTVSVVNPNSDDAHRYADTYETCECGAIFTHPEPKTRDDTPVIRGANRHNDGCKVYHRYDMKASLMRQREAVIRESLYYGIRGVRLANRLQKKENHNTEVMNRLGIDAQTLRAEFRQRRANTMAELARLGYTRAEIGTVYGVNGSHVHRELDRYKDTTVREIKRGNA